MRSIFGAVGELRSVFPAKRKWHVDGPQGVRGRNSDNTMLREVLGWEPQLSLEDGLAITYRWIEDQVRADLIAKGELTSAMAN